MTPLLLLSVALLSSFDGEDLAEVARLQAHLSNVERTLRSRDASNLTQAQRAERTRNLDRLRAYWTRGVFPHNHTLRDRTPFFIDHRGVACAVGQLLRDSGEMELAHEIAAKDNNAKLKQMHFPALARWQEGSGLTLEEMAWIQPGYDYERTPPEPRQPVALYFDGKNWGAFPGPPFRTKTVVLLDKETALAGSGFEMAWWTKETIAESQRQQMTAPVVVLDSGCHCAAFQEGRLPGAGAPDPYTLWRAQPDAPANALLRLSSGRALVGLWSLGFKLREFTPHSSKKVSLSPEWERRLARLGEDEISGYRAKALFEVQGDLWLSLAEETVLRRRNGEWHAIKLPESAPELRFGDRVVRVIWGATPKDVWMLRGPDLLHWNGKVVEQVAWPFKEAPVKLLHAITGASPADVWALGEDLRHEGAVFHFDGVAWSAVDAPYVGPLIAAASTSGGQVVALGSGSVHSGLIRFDGKQWREETLPRHNAWAAMSALPTGEILLISQ